MKRLLLLLTVLTVSLMSHADKDAQQSLQLTDMERAFAKQNSEFAFNLFRQARQSQASMSGSQTSLVLSPLSITYALGMLVNGATDETQQQISSVLGGNDATPAVINSFCRKMLNASASFDENTEVFIANNIFVNEASGFHLLPDFVQQAADSYDTTPETRNFFDGQTRNVINQWASNHTNGMIEELLSEEEFDPTAISYLLNALYFKSEWQQPFDKELTQTASFDGQKSVCELMWQHSFFEYAEDNLCQSIRLPYGNGAFQMTVFLPQQGKTLDDLLATMSGNTWNTMDYESSFVSLALPRFETNTDQKLNDILTLLGMPRAFDCDNAQFGNFAVNEALPDMIIYIGLIKQMAKIRVNESGTEAAAVTVDAMSGGSSIHKQVSFIANRPFLYVISERSTGTIFFMGQYTGSTTTAIDAPAPDHRPHTVYNLSGQRLDGIPKKGIFIRDGKKIGR